MPDLRSKSFRAKISLAVSPELGSELSQTNGFLFEHRDSSYHRDDSTPIHQLYGIAHSCVRYFANAIVVPT